jgi:hypothetical protein
MLLNPLLDVLLLQTTEDNPVVKWPVFTGHSGQLFREIDVWTFSLHSFDQNSPSPNQIHRIIMVLDEDAYTSDTAL